MTEEERKDVEEFIATLPPADQEDIRHVVDLYDKASPEKREIVSRLLLGEMSEEEMQALKKKYNRNTPDKSE